MTLLPRIVSAMGLEPGPIAMNKARRVLEVLPGWEPIESAPAMMAILLYHEYYSHGRVRHGYMNRKGEWIGVNAIGTENAIRFEPTHWMPLPEAPKP